MGRIAGRFARVEPRRRARSLVLGLLWDLPRKNCWTIAEHAGHGAQHRQGAPIPGRARAAHPALPLLNSCQGMGEGGRNGDVRGPTTPYAWGGLGELRSAVKARATSSATPTATRWRNAQRNIQRNGFT